MQTSVYFTGKDVSKPETIESAAYAEAVQVLNSVVASICTWEVTVENIDTITRNDKNFERILRCYHGQPGSTADVDCDNILERAKKLACVVAQFEHMRRNLQFLCERCALLLPARGRGKG